MSVLLGAPLLPAALAATLVSFALRGGDLLGAFTALAVLAIMSGLAIASVGLRRLVWSAAALAVAAILSHAGSVLALLPLRAVSLELPRAAIGAPIALLVPAPESALLLGIVLGERDGVPAALSRAFAASGTTHLLAISGFNMTLVATAIALALKGRAAPATRAAISLGAIVMYSLLVGLSPSVLRAALMSGVAAFGVASGRHAATANALCAAISLMLIADPASVDDLGLQLSALATAGLVVWQSPLSERLSRLPSPIREGFATTIAATVPTLPIVAGAFGRVSLVSPLANLVCVPLFPLLMLSGAATGAIGALSLDAARPVALLAWASAAVLRTSVETFASLPAATLSIPDGLPSGLAVALLEIGTFVLIRAAAARRGGLASGSVAGWWAWLRGLRPPAARLPTRRGAALLLVAGAIVPAVAVVAIPPAAATIRVIALDVGQGDAYLVDTGSALALVDGGPDPSRVLDELGTTLPPWHRRIDVVALTHAHTDHGAGLLAVLERYDVGVTLEPAGLNQSPLTDLWSAAIAKRGIERRAVHAGQRVQLGDATIEVLAPDEDLRVDTPSLVLRVARGSFSVLFTGDAVDDALARLLEHPERLQSRIYVPPHHGAETPYAAALRASARPDAALLSVGAGNRYGHPTPQTLQALTGVPTYRTDTDGTVEIALDGTGLVVRTHANALPPPRRGPLPYPAARQ